MASSSNISDICNSSLVNKHLLLEIFHTPKNLDCLRPFYDKTKHVKPMIHKTGSKQLYSYESVSSFIKRTQANNDIQITVRYGSSYLFGYFNCKLGFCSLVSNLR